MLHSLLILSCLLGSYAQNTNSGFIGYRKTGTAYVTASCPDPTAKFATSGSFWGCSPYPAAGLGLVTGCTLGTLLVGGSNQYTCVPGDECNTGYWFSDLNDQSPLSEYGCLDGGTTSYYRSLPASVLAAATGVTSSALSTGTSSATGPVPEASSQISGSSSKAWIAGAVIGPVFGVALLVGIGILIWTLRKQTKQRQLAQSQQPAAAPIFGAGPPAPTTEQSKGTWVFVPAEVAAAAPQTGSHPPASLPRESELPAAPPVSEAPTQRDPVELDSGAQNS